MGVFIFEEKEADRVKVEKIVHRFGFKDKSLIVFQNCNFINEELFSSGFSSLNLYLLALCFNNDQLAGIEIAKKIRLKDPEGLIVIMSSYPQCILEIINARISVFTLIDKNQQFDDILSEVLQDYQERLMVKNPFFMLPGKKEIVAKKDILMIETYGAHQLKLTTLQQTFLFRSTIKNSMNQLTEFWRVHESFLLNPHFVSVIDFSKNEITLSSGHRAPIGRKYKPFL
ncbi:response regulator transcription factor [Enterococcus timonensis]|uniref:response regulator transcription factor n=1 Tax=Enterococcus timonensis TaxID=1852364 RepID=UPI0008DA7DB0|nr:response regulator transcription factor [Enterococcus timonensis]